MSLFAIIGHDVPESTTLRQQHRPAHLARLQQLDAEKRIITSGPLPTEHGADTMTGSLLIIDFDDLAHAQAWVNEEPFLLNGVYSHVDVKPFIQVLPKE